MNQKTKVTAFNREARTVSFELAPGVAAAFDSISGPAAFKQRILAAALAEGITAIADFQEDADEPMTAHFMFGYCAGTGPADARATWWKPRMKPDAAAAALDDVRQAGEGGGTAIMAADNVLAFEK
jgi:hypothetical protein